MGPRQIEKLLGESDKKEIFLSSVDFCISHGRSEILCLKIFPSSLILLVLAIMRSIFRDRAPLISVGKFGFQKGVK